VLSTRVQQHPASVMYGNETCHTDRHGSVRKPHMQCYVTVTVTRVCVIFTLLTVALNPTRVGRFGDFQHLLRRISENVRDRILVQRAAVVRGSV